MAPRALVAYLCPVDANVAATSDSVLSWEGLSPHRTSGGSSRWHLETGTGPGHTSALNFPWRPEKSCGGGMMGRPVSNGRTCHTDGQKWQGGELTATPPITTCLQGDSVFCLTTCHSDGGSWLISCSKWVMGFKSFAKHVLHVRSFSFCILFHVQ